VPKDVGTEFAMVALVETGNLVLVENGAMEQLKQATVSRADHLKRPIAAGTISVDAEVIVEARNSNDPEPLHDGKACAVDDRECLIRKCHANRPGGAQVSGRDEFNPDSGLLELLPKVVGNVPAIAAIQE
jgi:hypothetical protein